MSGTGGTNQNPWDSPLFRRPSSVDFNGSQKQDDPNLPPPNPNTDPSAEEYNTMQFAIVATATMVGSAEVGVFAGVSPSIGSVASANDAVNGNTGAFYLTRNSAGNYTIETMTGIYALPAPPNGAYPHCGLVGVCGAHSYSIMANYTVGTHGNLAIQVTTNQDTTPTDLNFWVLFR